MKSYEAKFTKESHVIERKQVERIMVAGSQLWW